MSVRAGSFEELRKVGRLLTKVGSLPVVVFWDDDRAYAIEDRCPHMGFPLHQGTVECGLVTCHWHHARFDLASGCTLDPFADDARGFDVIVDGDDVVVVGARHRRSGAAPPTATRAGPRGRPHARHRQVGARLARSRRRAVRDRARRDRLRDARPRRWVGRRPHGARGDGEPVAAPRRSRPRARAHARSCVRVARHAQPAAALRGSTRSTPASLPNGSASGTGASSRPGRLTRRNAR